MEKKLAIFGINGRTGVEVARVAIARGWQVSGLVRAGSVTPGEISGARIIHGGFTNSTSVVDTIDGSSAVVCVIGPRPPYTEVFCAAATNAIITAMKSLGCRRLLCQTGAMIGAAPNRSYFMDVMARSFSKKQPEAALDRVDQERAVMNSELDWTIIKPPRLSNTTAKGRYSAGTSLPIGMLSKISRVDLASFTLDALEQNHFIKQRVFVKA